MNPKILRPQNPNKKKLLLTKSSKESLEELPQPPPLKNGCCHSHPLQNQRGFSIKHGEGTLLPPISDLSKSRISISLPPEGARTRRKSATSHLFTTCKTKQSSFFSLLKGKSLKMEPLLTNFVADFLAKEVFHMHFGNYLVQPKTFYRILLFAISSFNNSKNMSNFQRIFMEYENFQELVDQVERGSFSFEFGVRNNHKMELDCQTVDQRIENSLRIAAESEGEVLVGKNQELNREINEKRNDLQNIQSSIAKCRVQIDNLTTQIRRLNGQIMRQNETLSSLNNSITQSTKMYEQLESNKKRFSAFMINFSQNRCNQVAVDTRRLEQELHEYVEYLNFHPLGKRPYEKSKFSCDLQRMLTNEQQSFCKFISTDGLSPEGRLKPTRDFLAKTREEYNSIINELLIVIQEKTEFISKFTVKMGQWQENYSRRKGILNELNRILQCQALNLEEAKGYRQSAEHYRYSKHGSSEKEGKIITVAERIITIYQIAASFI